MPELQQPNQPQILSEKTDIQKKLKEVRFENVQSVNEVSRSRSYLGSKHERRTKVSRRHSTHHKDETDNISICSTCSSSSSSEDFDYELPPRRAYGGVRISYVPNDAFAAARRRRQEGLSGAGSPSRADNKNCIIS